MNKYRPIGEGLDNVVSLLLVHGWNAIDRSQETGIRGGFRLPTVAWEWSDGSGMECS